MYWWFLHISILKGLIWNLFLFPVQIGKQRSWVIPWEDVSHSRCYAMRSCYLLQSLLEELPCHSETWMKITQSHSSSHITTAKINSVCCRTSVSKSSLFENTPVCTETLPLKGDNVKNILLHFAMNIYLHMLSGRCPVISNTVTSGWLFLWHWVPALCQ